jgi:hypothetical protein
MKIGLKTPRGVGYDDLWGMHHHHRMDLKEPVNPRLYWEGCAKCQLE